MSLLCSESFSFFHYLIQNNRNTFDKTSQELLSDIQKKKIKNKKSAAKKKCIIIILKYLQNEKSFYFAMSTTKKNLF